MDYMNIDLVLDVPDTPDRLAAHNNGKEFTEGRSSSPVICHPGNTNISDDGTREWLRGRITLDGHGGPPRRLGIFQKAECNGNPTASALGKSSSTRNAHLLRRKRKVADEMAHHESELSLHSKHIEKGKALCPSLSSPNQENNAVTDLKEQNGHALELGKAIRLKNCQAQDFGKGAISTCGSPSLNGIRNPSTKINISCKGKEKMDDTFKVSSVLDCGKKIEVLRNFQPDASKRESTSFHTFISPCLTGQKRLVRNGCISPHNIARAKQFAEKHNGGSEDGVLNDASEINIRDLVAGDNSALVRGKGMVKHHFSSEEPDSKTIDLSSRCFDGFGGWRHNRRMKKHHEGGHFSRGKNELFVNKQQNSEVRRDNHNARSVGTRDSCPKSQDWISCQHGSSRRVAQVATTIKKQKQGSTCGECSMSAIDGSECMFLGSSGEPSKAMSTRNDNRGLGNFDSVVEIDEFSPGGSHRGCHVIDSRSNDDPSSRARQIEADEKLAHELQEQLYNEPAGNECDEFLSFTYEQVDAHMALILQQEEDSQCHRIFYPNLSARRGSRARLASRMQNGRSSFHRRSPRMLSRERNSLFRPNVDVDMQIRILEELEAFTDMGTTSHFLQVQRDFNENDYEMLLALDENNHHLGASLDQITGLPQSTVQSENLQEACAICLETPTTGDIIRHLPCLHKFHKDCIDPWLRRKTSCPVCKSSIS